MNDIYNEINKQNSEPSVNRREPFNKEAYKEKKMAEKEQVFDMVEEMVFEIKDDADKFREYLDTQSRFDRYSVSNALLIMKQMPQATKLKSYDDWKNAHVNIRKNAKSIKILEPIPYERQDGTIGTSYNVKKMFDITQTNAMKKIVPANKSEANRDLLKALIDKAPVFINVSDERAGDKGAFYDSREQTVFVARGLEPEEFFKCVSLELAHAELDLTSNDYSREDSSYSAECISYMLCRKCGIETSHCQIDKLPEKFSDMDTKEFRGELSTIRDGMQEINSRMQISFSKQREAKNAEQER